MFNPKIMWVPAKGWCLVHNTLNYRISPYMEKRHEVMQFSFEHNMDINNMVSYSDDALYDIIMEENIRNNEHIVQPMD